MQCLPDGLSVRLAGPDGKEHTFGYDKVFRPEAGQVGGEGRRVEWFRGMGGGGTQWRCRLQAAFDLWQVCPPCSPECPTPPQLQSNNPRRPRCLRR